jgi:nitrite reductase/ring-hydroxylating ferredoxin subunit
MGKLDTFWYASVTLSVIVAGIQFSVIQLHQNVQCQNLWTVVTTIFGMWTMVVPLLPYFVVRLYIFLFVPYIYKKSLANCKAAPTNMNKRLQNSGNVPPPFPTGWFFISHSDELKKGQVKSVSFFDREYALFRGEDGTARILSAFCPHLGANLANGGIVHDNCLTCPFHGWVFNGEGKVSLILSESLEIII